MQKNIWLWLLGVLPLWAVLCELPERWRCVSLTARKHGCRRLKKLMMTSEIKEKSQI